MRLAVLLFVLMPFPVSAQETVPLKWSLKEGDKFFAKNATKMDMDVTAMGLMNKVKMSITTVQRFKVLSTKSDSTTVEMTIQEMETSMDGAGAGIPGLDAIGEKLKGVALTATLDENMNVTKLQGYDKFLDKLAGDNSAQRMQIKQQLSEAAMSQMFSQVFSFGTSKPVKVGDTWPRTEKLAMNGLDATVKTKYKLDSVTSGIAKLSLTGEVNFKPGPLLPLPEGFKVNKFDLKADKYTGSMKFDTNAGRLTESIMNSDMSGGMTIAFGGQNIDMTMLIKLKQTVTIDDKNPIKD